MLETLYQTTEQNGQEAASVTAFHDQYVKGAEAEDKFFAAIRDSRLIGFKEGFKAAFALYAEIA